MRRGRILMGAGAVAAAIGLTLLGGALRGSGSASARSVPGAEIAFGGGFAAGNTAALVSALQAQLTARPSDVHGLALLGLAYEQRARETGDPAYYPKADGVLRRALSLHPGDLLATAGLGSLALSRHRFREALALGRRAVRISPTTASSYGIVGDALVELGRYEAAFHAFDTMARLRPGLASYARVSYARELLGRVGAAEQAMRMAVSTALGQREPLAWTHVQLGKIYWSAGGVTAAGAQYEAALRAFPGYVYALDQLALVEAARGHVRLATSLERRAVEQIPLPQFVGTLGDLYRISGRARLAREQYALIAVIRRLLQANGVKTDLETALFNVDHGVRLPEALQLARAAYRDRPSLDGNDVLAWALARNGRCSEALHYSRRALRLGTRDASKYFHRGMIERCVGHRRSARTWFARALRLNPHFSLLWAPVARRAVS